MVKLKRAASASFGENFSSRFISAFNNEDEKGISDLLNPRLAVSTPLSSFPGPVGEFVTAWAKFQSQLAISEGKSALENLATAVRKFADILTLEETGSFLARGFARLLRLLRRLAAKLDADGLLPSTRWSRAVVEILRELFPRFHRDKSKFATTCLVASELCSLYLQLEQVKLAGPVLAAIGPDNGCPVPKFIKVPLLVNWGRVALAQENFSLAMTRFELAYNLTGQTDILRNYLVPLKLLVEGKVLKRESRSDDCYAKIAAAVRTGNLALFEKTIETHSREFLSLGTLSVVERLRLLVQRRLVENVVRIVSRGDLANIGHRVDLGIVQHVWTWQTLPGGTDKAAFFSALVHLLNCGAIKGYLSFEHWKLVLSKVESFPPVSSWIG